MNTARTQNVGDIAAFNKDIEMWVSIATAVLIVCILLALFVSLKQKQKDFKGRTVLSKLMTNDSTSFVPAENSCGPNKVNSNSCMETCIGGTTVGLTGRCCYMGNESV